MQRIINGKSYNTRTARELCEAGSTTNSRSDFSFEESNLYVTKKGAYFIAGRGGPMSRFARSVEDGNTTTGGSGIIPLDEIDARDILENAGAEDILEELFDIEEA